MEKYAATSHIDHELLAEIYRLEESLWQAKTRYDDTYMEKILAPDFFEFGRSGRRYTRAEMFVGASAFGEISATLPLPQFRARLLHEDTVQTTYISEIKRNRIIERANRSSIWRHGSSGWQLWFHQGTPIIAD
ncbi:MAG: DUF4440 domain-containing protein [Pseudomonadota bacterium]